MSNHGQTIEIYLPDGEPRGVRFAGITTRIVQAIQSPRTKLDQLLSRPEANRVAIYFLFGPTSSGAKTSVYIGQTEDLATRLKKHNAEKDFWTSVVAITSKTDSFTQVHVKYLEWYSIKRAKEASRFAIENGNASGKPFIPEPLEADVLDTFETATLLLSTLGFPLFEPPAGKSSNGQERFYCRGQLADGVGDLVEDGFVLLKGSLCRKELSPSSLVLAPTVKKLLTAGVLKAHSKEQLVLTEDYVCNSPSLAAGIVLGRKSNGWTEWKNSDGKTLDEVYRQPNDS